MHLNDREDDPSDMNRTLSASELADPAFLSKADVKHSRLSGPETHLASQSGRLKQQDSTLTVSSGSLTATKAEDKDSHRRSESSPVGGSGEALMAPKNLAKMNKKERKAYEARKAKHEELVQQSKAEAARKAAAAVAAAEQQKRDEEARERRLAEQEEFARQMRLRRLMEEQRAAKRRAELQKQQVVKLLPLPKQGKEKDSKESSDREATPRTPTRNEEEILQQVAWTSLPAKKKSSHQQALEAAKGKSLPLDPTEEAPHAEEQTPGLPAPGGASDSQSEAAGSAAGSADNPATPPRKQSLLSDQQSDASNQASEEDKSQRAMSAGRQGGKGPKVGTNQREQRSPLGVAANPRNQRQVTSAAANPATGAYQRRERPPQKTYQVKHANSGANAPAGN